VTKGIGLELDFAPNAEIPRIEDGEVSALASYGLMLLSEAMSSTNETIKFVRMMTLFEFLASPNHYENWQKAKTKIACHIASDREEYESLLERFREFSSKKIDGKETGFRTLIIHQGKLLPSLVEDVGQRKALFRELQDYASAVLEDMMDNKTMSWSEYMDRRDMLKKSIGVKN
jgi:hypothetical protein